MTVLITILLLLSGVFILTLLLALFMKKEHYVKRQITINVPAQSAYDFLKLLGNQEKFNKWAKTDPNRIWEHKGTDGTVGYIISWKGNKSAGEGQKEIIGLVEGKKIETEIRFVKPMKVTSSITMETEAQSANQTTVSLINSGKMKYPMNIFIPMAEKNFPKDMDESLATLKEILEKGN